MEEYGLEITLESDACFCSGPGFAGEADLDIEQERCGLPIIRGRSLKGLLTEECAFLLKVFSEKCWQEAAAAMFGAPGGKEIAKLRIQNAYLPGSLRIACLEAIDRPDNPLRPDQILRSLSTVRFQTKINAQGVPQKHSLRSTRLALKGLCFFSSLKGGETLTKDEKALLAACVLSLRRGGLNRNRGWGKMKVRIVNSKGAYVTSDWIGPFNSAKIRSDV